MEERWQYISRIWKEWKNSYQVLGGVVVASVLAMLGWRAFAAGAFDDYTTNFVTEMLGVGVTILIVNQLAAMRETNRRKQQLFREAKRPDNSMAINALHELKHERWLDEFFATEKKNLNHVDWSGERDMLNEANLQGAGLRRAQLQEVWLKGANLQGADLGIANFEGANLRDTNLRNANLWVAHLSGAYCHRANLQGADLRVANLQGADLREANLQGAVLIYKYKDTPNYAQFNEHTTLPDGTMYDPEKSIEQMERFGSIVRWEDVPDEIKNRQVLEN